MRLNFNVDTDAVDARRAAAGLGVSARTLSRLRRLGLVPAFSIPSRTQGKQIWRYPIAGLYAYRKSQRNYIRAWDPHSGEFPVVAIARLLDVSVQDVYTQRHRGRLKNYSPGAVRNYLLRISRKRLTGEIRKEFVSRLSRLRGEVRRLRRLLKLAHCQCCTKGLSR